MATDKDRHVVKIDIRSADTTWELCEEDLEEDNLEKVSQLLKQSQESDETAYDDPAPVKIRFDLCAKCRDRFLKNPFNCQSVAKFNFSEN